MRFLPGLFAVCLVSLNVLPAFAGAKEAPAPRLLPAPAHMQLSEGRYRPGASARVAIPADDADGRALGELAVTILREAWGVPVELQHGGDRRADLTLALQPAPGANPEGYRLAVNADGIRLTSATPAGLFYGLQTLRQLAPPNSAKTGVPALAIEDAPRFGYRGLMLDVGRHLYPLDFLKRTLDLMARYKFNTFHWHLTEDQGWRLEIKRYPKLTEVGAWRARTSIQHRDGPDTFDERRYGGFYTQAEARELVAYAKQLHIQVIPEIEMPGHTVAALAAYPELACTPGPFEVRATWGVDDNVLCPSEATFTFIENVLTEVMDIFPSPYIHLGGDEAPIVRWQQSPLAQDIIRREGLKDEHALQGWFMRRVEKYLHEHGRKVIGWDEILDGNPLPSATVMSWRGMDGGIVAARRGHDVIMSPTSHVYLDYCQSLSKDEPVCSGNLPLRQVYAFEPVPDKLTPAQAKHVIGAQGNVWTERMRSSDAVEYMLWPRALALSEVLWSPREGRGWEDFNRRLEPQLQFLDTLRVNYRVPDVIGLEGDAISLQPQTKVRLTSPLPDARVRYSLDGSAPTSASPAYEGPIALALEPGGTVVSARLELPGGRLGPISRAHYALAQLQPASNIERKKLRPGLERDYYEVAITRTEQLLSQKAVRSETVRDIGLPEEARPDTFGLRYRGYIAVPSDGVYRFVLGSDDGARLLIDDKLVVDRDGPQSPGDSYGSVALGAGLHAFELRYFQGGGDKQLQLLVERDGATAVPVPHDWWLH
ncbi:family 20 glycosylhydrolase [Luteimonas panaciterrae]|uniref:family 20 glycosylhydrolase n=1 Tax=Luteimonas panaciterrae TaxID=363885 RepID=UPI001CF9EEFC|nr:family 20 glycosylhydrolase [Luteimonas panaciterrae]